jgi:hypothetical protein
MLCYVFHACIITTAVVNTQYAELFLLYFNVCTRIVLFIHVDIE